MKQQVEVKRQNDSAREITLAELLNDFSIDAIIAIDTDHNVIAWNRTAATMYEHSKKQALGKSLFELIPSLKEDAATMKAIEQALKGFKSFVPASKLFSHRKQSENHYIPLKDGDGNVIGAMNIVHDVAHRIKAEQQLQYLNEELERRYRQLKSTSDELASFTYITSNKIKEPIRHIYTGVEHLIKAEAGRLTDSGKATFRRMQSSLSRMDLLLDDILSLAQISILQKPEADVDINYIVQEAAAQVEKKADKNIKIIIDELCVIKGYENYLRVLFYNLLDNAVKFNKSSEPEIRITCKKTVLNDVTGDLLPGTEYYKVTIADNGIGFDMAESERIFNMFEKLHEKEYKGSGIGLTMAKKIMEAHDGFITVESTPGIGSSFNCFFQVAE